MTIEETLSVHYRTIEVDEPAERRLQAFITTLGEQTRNTEQPTSRSHVGSRSTALALAACVLAAVTAGVVWAGRASGTQGPVADTASPTSTTVTPVVAPKAGFIDVVNAHGVAGLIRQTDVDAVGSRIEETASPARLNPARSRLTVVLPLFDSVGGRVIGEWNAAGTAFLAVFCARRDGVAFRVPAVGRSGDSTPVAAARALGTELSLAGFGDSRTEWTVRSRTPTAATLTAATTTLHAEARADGTWVITSGQRCFT